MNHVTKQLAIKLKQAGFDGITWDYYHDTDETTGRHPEWQDWNKMRGKYYSAPTLHQAADFLRERHGLHVFADPFKDKWSWNITEISNDEFDCSDEYSYTTHAEALAIGIDKAVDEVLKRMNNGLEQQ